MSAHRGGRLRTAGVGTLAVLLSTTMGAAPALAADPWLVRASVSYTGDELQPGPDIEIGTENIAISGDGRYVVFSHASPELVADDTNGHADVFLRDLQTGTNELISVPTGAREMVQAARPTRLH